jgi:hypothetical protein
MKSHQVIDAIEEGRDIVGTARITFCDYSAGVHATLTALARESGWARAIVLRAVCGWITEARKVAGCIK